MIKTIIFDMYGVIIKDPTGNLMPFLNSLWPGLTDRDVYQHWLKAGVGETPSEAFWAGIGAGPDWAEIEKRYLDSLDINEEFFAAADKLKTRYNLALISNDVSEWGQYLRKKFGLDKYFDAIAVSGDVGVKKPDPAIYTRVLGELNRSADECVYIDDRRHNLFAAEQLGMDVILFNSRAVEYSGKTVHTYDELLDLLLSERTAL